MNKELIKKYKTEFDHWLNEGSLLWCRARDGVKRWEVVKDSHTDFFNTNDAYYIYVINDEYVEFRKALVEGKTIQFHYINPTLGLDEWQTINDINSLTFSHSIDLYRIKPEKPQFKVGDWVRNSISRSDIGKVLEFTDEGYSKTVCLTHNEHCFLQWEHWKPQSKEWCWSTVFGLVKVICETTEAGKPCYLCWNPWKKVEQKLNNLEPFIGTLPTFLQK